MYFREIKGDTYFDYYTIEKGDNLYKISKEYNINPIIDIKHIWDKDEKYKEIENKPIMKMINESSLPHS